MQELRRGIQRHLRFSRSKGLRYYNIECRQMPLFRQIPATEGTEKRDNIQLYVQHWLCMALCNKGRACFGKPIPLRHLHLSSKVFHQTKYGEGKEKELDGITYCGHKATASQIHTTLNPKPTRRHRVGPTNNANHKAEDCTQRTYNK